MTEDIIGFLKRASERTGFIRESYVESQIPTTSSNIVVLPFFGDLEGQAILSSFILKRYREKAWGNKYFILCSWVGCRPLYPYVSEYWSIEDKEFAKSSLILDNNSTYSTLYRRNLNNYFENVIELSEIKSLYDNGFKDKYFEKLNSITRYLPMMQSSNVMNRSVSSQLNRINGPAVLISPTISVKTWRNHRCENLKVSKEFWVSLVKFLFENGIFPVVWQNIFTYNISTEVVDKSVVFEENDLSIVLSTMRSIGCVLDVFNGISKLAYIARCPTVICEERSRYINCKSYEIDDLSVRSPRQYIFTFTNMIEGDNWEQNLFKNINNKLTEFLPTLDRNNWAATSESYTAVPYEKVKERKLNRLGTKFIKVPKE